MAKMVCTVCGTVGDSKTHVKGSFFIELLLWLFFLVPGLIYTIWRLTTKAKVCPACRSESIVPLNTPMGRKLTGG